MSNSAAASRPWRNRNPGDLRTLVLPEHWYGQSGIDNGPGGPFAVFATRTDGWRALAACLLTYQDVHRLHTVRGIIGRFAPALENDVGGYVSLVCRQIGRGPDQPISMHDLPTALALVHAIALAEGGARLAWPQDEILAGVQLAGVGGPAAAPIAKPSSSPAPTEVDPANTLDTTYNKRSLSDG